MTIHLPENLEQSILAGVRSGDFPSVDEAMAEAVRLLLRERGRVEALPKQDDADVPLPPGYRPIWEEIAEITATIPDEVWDTLPTDGAEQHDHYIYGTPKRPSTQ